MGRPINNKFFGNGGGKLSVKFYDGSSVVTGTIVSQVGSRKFKVTDGTTTKICRLATTTEELALLTAGTALTGVARADLCTMEAAIVGGATENVKSLSMNKITTVQGTTVTYKAGVTGGAGTGTMGVAEIALLASAPVNGTGTVAAAFSYVVPAFTGGNAPLVYTMSKSGTGSSVFVFDASTRTVSKPVTSGTAGVTTIVITATDADGDTASATFTVTVS